MKILIFLCGICAVIAFGCAKTESPKTSETKSQTTEISQNLQSNFDEPILEVTSDFWGMVNINGKVIDFRLFEDGIAEYDSYHLVGLTEVKAEDVKSTKRVKISEEQIKDFIDFLTSKEFLSTKGRYNKKPCFAQDAGVDIEINFKYGTSKKQIAIIRDCEPLPETISTLREKIEKITKQ